MRTLCRHGKIGSAVNLYWTIGTLKVTLSVLTSITVIKNNRCPQGFWIKKFPIQPRVERHLGLQEVNFTSNIKIRCINIANIITRVRFLQCEVHLESWGQSCGTKQTVQPDPTDGGKIHYPRKPFSSVNAEHPKYQLIAKRALKEFY